MAASDDSQVLERAKARYKIAKEAWATIYQKAIDDLKFLSDEPLCQWDEQEAAARVAVGRPTIQADPLGQFVHQTTNEIRMNTPTINVIPSDDATDIETSEVIQGRVRAIEYKSNADAAYDLAADFSVKSSIGFIRVDHDFKNGKGFEQELRIKRVINPKSILIDPDIIEPDGCDAMYGFAFEEKTKKTFERENRGKMAASFGDESPRKDLKDDDKIVIAEYFEILIEGKDYGLNEDGTDEPVVKGKEYKMTRTIETRTVMRYKLSGEDVLDSTRFPGIYVPLVPVFGEEQWIDGKRSVYSLIRKSKSAVRNLHLWKSLEMEILLKQQQAPVQAAVGQMRGFEEDWKHPEKAMVLYYHQTDAMKNQAPAPQRLQPPLVPTGIVNASREAIEDIRGTLGMYRASVGDTREQARSGVALKQLERSGDMANFHFGDNLVRSIAQVGKILVSALPDVEDTERVVQIIGKEEESKTIGINGKRVDGQERDYWFTKGAHDVRVTTGPSFTTQRQEAAELYNQVVTQQPELMPVIGDLVFKYQDAPGAQAISARLRKTIDPKLLDKSELEKSEEDPQITAMTQQMQQLQTEAQQAIQQLQAQLQDKTQETALQTQANELKAKELQVKEMEAEAKLIQARRPESSPLDTAVDDHVKMRQIELAEAKFEFEVAQAAKQGLVDTPEGIQQQQEQDNEIAEQEAMEREQMRVLEEIKMRQAQSVIAALGDISANLSGISQMMAAPIVFQKDENGNIVGAN